ATLPAASVAVQVTVVVPTANWAPDGGVQTTTGGEQLSVAVTSNRTVALLSQELILTLRSPGSRNTGFSRSTTVMVNVLVARFPAASRATQTTVVVPLGKTEPDSGWQTTVAPGWLSLTVTL